MNEHASTQVNNPDNSIIRKERCRSSTLLTHAVMRWQGSRMNCLHRNSNTNMRQSPTWEEINNRPSTRIGKQMNVEEDAHKKERKTTKTNKKTLRHANDLALGSCSSCQESPFQFEWIWIKRISHEGQVWTKQHFVCKSTGSKSSMQFLPLSCCHLSGPKHSRRLSVKMHHFLLRIHSSLTHVHSYQPET